MSGLFFDQALLPQGWARAVRIAVEGGRIVSAVSDSVAEQSDERHDIGLPGMSNLHSHAFQRGMAGLSEMRATSADSFWTWRDVMYRFVGRMTPDDIEVVAAQAYVEMLEAGFTRVGEFHYIHHDMSGAPYANVAELAERIVAATDASGISLTLLPVFYAHAGFGGHDPDPGQRRFINSIDGFARLMEASGRLIAGRESAVIGLAPHSLRAVTPGELEALLAIRVDGPVHIHIAEQVREVEDCLAWSGQPPLQWLFNHAPVDRRWCLIHATHATPDDIRAIANSGAIVGLCPVTEANLGDGTFDAPHFIGQGGVFGVGTDSNVSIGLTEELRQLEYSQRLVLKARNVVSSHQFTSTGRALFDSALRGGSQALGVATVGLVEGAFADIVSLDGESVVLTGRSADAILDSWIFSASRPVVDCVWARGDKVVQDGRHIRRDIVASRFRRTIKELLSA